MEAQVTLDTTYVPSEDIVAREIEGEIIIVPLTAAVADADGQADALYTLNDTGKAIWERLDGQRSLKDVAAELAAEYEAPAGEIEADVLGLVAELVSRRMLAQVGSAPPP